MVQQPRHAAASIMLQPRQAFYLRPRLRDTAQVAINVAGDFAPGAIPMALEWRYAQDNIDWDGLADLYRVAPRPER